jgi:hypothetical protein
VAAGTYHNQIAVAFGVATSEPINRLWFQQPEHDLSLSTRQSVPESKDGSCVQGQADIRTCRKRAWIGVHDNKLPTQATQAQAKLFGRG